MRFLLSIKYKNRINRNTSFVMNDFKTIKKIIKVSLFYMTSYLD